MKLIALALAATTTLALSGCSVGELANTAADAAACKAAESGITGVLAAYNAGLVDSGVIEQLRTLAAGPATALLSTQLATDFQNLITALSETDGAMGASAKIAELQASITERCAAVGVVFGN